MDQLKQLALQYLNGELTDLEWRNNVVVQILKIGDHAELVELAIAVDHCQTKAA